MRKRWLISLAGSAAVLAGFGIYFGVVASRPAPFESMKVGLVPTAGLTTDAAISPDGKSVAYVLQSAFGQSIWLRRRGVSPDRQILALAPGERRELMFSPNGSDVYYVQGRAGASWTGRLYRLNVAGGAPLLVIENISGRIAFSRDGRRIAFIRLEMTPRMESLIVANSNGSGQRVIATRRNPRYFARDGLTWSPDERSIVCLAGDASYYGPHAFRLVEIGIYSGSERLLTAGGWAWPGAVMWTADRHNLIVGAGSSEDWGQVWRVSYPGGQIHRITNDLGDYTTLTQTADSKTLLAVRREQSADLWLTPAAYRGQPVQIPATNLRRLSWAVWVSGEQIIFSALAGDSRNIWTMDAQGGNRRQLTTAEFDQTEIAVSRDRRYLAYFAQGHIWRANLDGSGARQLTHGALDVHPAFSPDGKWVVYASFSNWSPAIGGQPMLWKVPVDGGDAIQVTSDNTSLPDVSPNGKFIACASYRYDRPNQPTRIAIYPFAGGRATEYFNRPPGAGESVYWNADGAALDYVVSADGVGNVWRQPLDGSPPIQITAFRAGRILFRTVSPDKKMLLLGRGQETNDLVLLSDIR